MSRRTTAARATTDGRAPRLRAAGLPATGAPRPTSVDARAPRAAAPPPRPTAERTAGRPRPRGRRRGRQRQHGAHGTNGARGERPAHGTPGNGGQRVGNGCTAPQLRRFIKSRPYVPMHELRRRFGIDGNDDDVTQVRIDGGAIYVGLPQREGIAPRRPAARRRDRLRAVARPAHADRRRRLPDASRPAFLTPGISSGPRRGPRPHRTAPSGATAHQYHSGPLSLSAR